ncbi:hypothetical protein C6P61_17460 [Malikia spinosa]|uniref:Uncharacterized protein n=1 Tax=Malikia spinosa TaxID=86180 RepID=A0A2S9K9V7_9BURK|nr:hypothetical protein C6P61_17460 [Malikia spinosa]
MGFAGRILRNGANSRFVEQGDAFPLCGQAPRFDELVQVALQRAAVGLVALAPLVFLVVNVSWPVVGLGPLADWYRL